MSIREELLSNAAFRQKLTLALPEAALEVLANVKAAPTRPEPDANGNVPEPPDGRPYRTPADVADARYAELVLGNLAAFVPRLVPITLALAASLPESALATVTTEQIRQFLVVNWDRLSLSFLQR